MFSQTVRPDIKPMNPCCSRDLEIPIRIAYIDSIIIRFSHALAPTFGPKSSRRRANDIVKTGL